MKMTDKEDKHAADKKHARKRREQKDMHRNDNRKKDVPLM